MGTIADKSRTRVFGAVVGELILGREVRSRTDLSRLLKATATHAPQGHGHHFEAPRLRDGPTASATLMAGSRWRSPRCYASRWRREAPSQAFAYGQGERINEGYLSAKEGADR
jgi:hypothetical protein